MHDREQPEIKFEGNKILDDYIEIFRNKEEQEGKTYANYKARFLKIKNKLSGSQDPEIKKDVEALEEIIDFIHYELPNIPVTLNGEVYDWPTLQELLVQHAGLAPDPKSRNQFTYANVSPDFRTKKDIEKLLLKLEGSSLKLDIANKNQNSDLTSSSQSASILSEQKNTSSIIPPAPSSVLSSSNSKSPSEFVYVAEEEEEEEESTLSSKPSKQKNTNVTSSVSPSVLPTQNNKNTVSPSSPAKDYGKSDRYMINNILASTPYSTKPKNSSSSGNTSNTQKSVTKNDDKKNDEKSLSLNDNNGNKKSNGDKKAGGLLSFFGVGGSGSKDKKPSLVKKASTPNDESKPEEHLLKYIVVGDKNPCKMAVIRRYVHNIYSHHSRSTIGVDFQLKVVNYSDDLTLKIQLWDIAGQERFGNMTRVYYKEAVCAIIVIDMSSRDSLNAAPSWLQDIQAKLPEAVIVVMGDYQKGKIVPEKSVQDFADKNDIFYFFVNTKDGTNVQESFATINKLVVSAQKLQVKNSVEENKQHDKREEHDNEKNNKRGFWPF